MIASDTAAGPTPQPAVRVQMYSTDFCPFCVRARQLLARKGVSAIEEVKVDRDPEARQRMIALSGRRSVPQIFIGETHVGGFDDLRALDRSGALDRLLGR